MTDKKYMRPVLDGLQDQINPAVDVDISYKFPGMNLFTSEPDLQRCGKCGSRGHRTNKCIDLCLRLVLFQAINWNYAEYIMKQTGAYKVTVGANNKGRIVKWGFAHFHSEEQLENAAEGLKKMHHDQQILEPITIHQFGPPSCCHLCGLIDDLAGDKKHKQKYCPLRKQPPRQDAPRYEDAPKGYTMTYA